jgi:hypothetical protein
MSLIFSHKQQKTAAKLITNPEWRINNLYKVINKEGNAVTFKLNWAQQDLYKNMWYMNVILKARQLGMSTMIALLFLDRCFWNSNQTAGIIAHTREDSEMLSEFRKTINAYVDDWSPKRVKEWICFSEDRKA